MSQTTTAPIPTSERAILKAQHLSEQLKLDLVVVSGSEFAIPRADTPYSVLAQLEHDADRAEQAWSEVEDERTWLEDGEQQTKHDAIWTQAGCLQRMAEQRGSVDIWRTVKAAWVEVLQTDPNGDEQDEFLAAALKAAVEQGRWEERATQNRIAGYSVSTG